jgi:hypothetical protein
MLPRTEEKVMRIVVILREDYFKAQALIGPMRTLTAGSLWCDVYLSDSDLDTLTRGGISYAASKS